MDTAVVLVGVDGGKAAERALAWAVEEAQRRGAVLRIVHVLDPLAQPLHQVGPVPPGVLHEAEQQSQAVLDGARATAAELAPRLPVEALRLRGPRVPTLLQEAERASIVVIGTHEGLFARGVGSVATHLTGHAPCPVVVVPERGSEPQEPRRVVVGVDGSPLSLAAVDFAADRASLDGAELVVVSAVKNPDELWLYGEDHRQDLVARARLRLSESVAGQRERHPDVAIDERVVVAHPVPALLEAAEGARLLVVGSHGRGRFAGMLLGSVSQALLRRAPCPVAVVRPHERSGA